MDDDLYDDLYDDVLLSGCIKEYDARMFSIYASEKR